MPRAADAADVCRRMSACYPPAISTGTGSQVQRPLATVVVGGMLIGPIMLLVVVPALQTMVLGGGRPASPTGAPPRVPADVTG
jgi:heavy metal efflux system protein